MGIAKNLQTIRKAKGYSREEVARKSEIKFYTYASYEGDQRTPPIAALKKISLVLNCTIDELVNED